MFETDSPIVYACPTDSFELMRGGRWLPGHERFIFPSIEVMLSQYPTIEDFKEEFQKFFRSLNPEEIYPENTLEFAEVHHQSDYCVSRYIPWNPGCNEVTFPKPTKIKNCKLFYSKEDLKEFYL
ncbi:Uncharacterised protein [uncultured archaeon]|nr:Uncharacterised protein [uncultured archaeon]